MNLLFDLDGTLTDSRQGIVACIGHALSRLDRPVPPAAELERFIGAPLRAVFTELLSSDSALVEPAVSAYRERFATLGMFENAVYEGVPEALDSLRRSGVRMFVATGKPRVFAGPILEHFGLAQHFTAIYGSELSGERAHKGELVAHVLERSHLNPAETVMIGDRYHDVSGALQNGVRPVGVLWGYGSREELEAAGAEHLIAEPADLEQLVA